MVTFSNTYEPDTGFKSRFFRYDNRINRKRYNLRQLSLSPVYLLIMFVAAFMVTGLWFRDETVAAIVTVIMTVLLIVAIISSVTLVIRRLHDLNRPGWFIIGMILPVVNIALLIYLSFFKGTEGSNQYGPDPLGLVK